MPERNRSDDIKLERKLAIALRVEIVLHAAHELSFMIILGVGYVVVECLIVGGLEGGICILHEYDEATLCTLENTLVHIADAPRTAAYC